MNSRTIRVGIIGFGLSGRFFHAPLLRCLSFYEVTRVLSKNPDTVRAIFPSARVVDELKDLLSEDVDLVINCAPNAYHYSYTKVALEAGKHVVVEKPFVHSFEEGSELIQLAKKKSLILSVYHNRRWDGDFLAVKKILASGVLGKITSFSARFDRVAPRPKVNWREEEGPGTGVLFDLGSHLIDQALILFGSPESILADVVTQREGTQSDDYFDLTLNYGNLRVKLGASCFTDLTPRFQIQGTQGNFRKFGFDPQEAVLRAGGSPLDPEFGIEEATKAGELDLWSTNQRSRAVIPSEKGSYLSFYQQLHRSIITGDSSLNPVTPESALEVVRLIELAHRSSREGKRLTWG